MEKTRRKTDSSFEPNDFKSSLDKEGKIPPHSLELEMGVLGGMMIDSSIIDTVLGILKPNHDLNVLP